MVKGKGETGRDWGVRDQGLGPNEMARLGTKVPVPHIKRPMIRAQYRLSCVAVLFSAQAGLLPAQTITWRTEVTLYGDNTEFFTPYRVGETILGGQLVSYLRGEPGRTTAVLAGFFVDRRSGSDRFQDDVKPVLSFHYGTPTSLFVVGSLVNQSGHGLMEPLHVTTLEFTRPMEYGLQYLGNHVAWDVDAFLNWQHLNTATSREIFDFGLALQARPTKAVTIEFQAHGLHHGGQLFRAGVPVSNNLATAIGARLEGGVPWVRHASLGVYHLQSKGNINPDAPSLEPRRGNGTLVRGIISPWKHWRFQGIYWDGKDFLSDEGDFNYNSEGVHPVGFYRSNRTYKELGALRNVPLDGGVTFDAEFRFHQIDDEKSLALFHSRWEYSYRLVFRAPFDVRLR